MLFEDRKEAGKLLAKKLIKYTGNKTVVYAIPRGGVIVGFEIAQALEVPLDLLIAHKIGHPTNSEYAIAAISENGQMIGNKYILESTDKIWLRQAIKREKEEIQRRLQIYLKRRKHISAKNKIVILVDDGVATGYTLRVAIFELKNQKPAKLIIAVPVIPEEIVFAIQQDVNEVVALEIPSEKKFLGAVGSYYKTFLPVEDDEITSLL